MAQRINNLLGKLTFSDEQLQKTQKGLAGVPMPNFGNVGRELAQEINEEPEEPEPEPETEDERVYCQLTFTRCISEGIMYRS